MHVQSCSFPYAPVAVAISVRTRARALLFNSNPNSLLWRNWAPWKNRGKKWKDAKSIFQRRLHGRRRCRIVRSPVERLENLGKNVLERRTLTGGGLFTFLSSGFAQIFSNFTSVKKLSNTNFIASRYRKDRATVGTSSKFDVAHFWLIDNP